MMEIDRMDVRHGVTSGCWIDGVGLSDRYGDLH